MKAPDKDKHADLLATNPTRSYTAPPAEHGRLHLAFGVLAAFVLLGQLNSCAAPARLPERPVSQHDGFDSRTKHREPYQHNGH